VAGAFAGDGVEGVAEELQLPRTAHHRRVSTARHSSGRRHHRDQSIGREWLSLALELERLEVFDRDRVGHELERLRADQDVVGTSRLLQPSRHVHGIARRQALRGPGDDLAGVDADP
jgi:hypothetical protein